MQQMFLSSITRISDLAAGNFAIEPWRASSGRRATTSSAGCTTRAAT